MKRSTASLWAVLLTSSWLGCFTFGFFCQHKMWQCVAVLMECAKLGMPGMHEAPVKLDKSARASNRKRLQHMTMLHSMAVSSCACDKYRSCLVLAHKHNSTLPYCTTCVEVLSNVVVSIYRKVCILRSSFPCVSFPVSSCYVQCLGQDQVQPAQGAEDCDGDELCHHAPHPQPPSGEVPAWQPTADPSFVGAAEGGRRRAHVSA